MKIITIVWTFLLVVGCEAAPVYPMADLTQIFQSRLDKFATILDNPENYRLQVLVSEVVTNAQGRPCLNRFGYRVDAEYFYPASAIKLGVAVATLQTIEQLQVEHHTSDLLNAPMVVAPLFPSDEDQTNDPGNLNGGYITLGHELRKLALISDNHAFNRLYDFVGHERLNLDLRELGLQSVVINRRLSDYRPISNPLATAAVTLLPLGAEPIIIPARTSSLSLSNQAANVQVGHGFVNGNKVVNAPKDFTTGNGMSLMDLQSLLISLARPDIDLGLGPLKISAAHRAWLLQAMTEYPRESTNPVYNARSYPDEYCKFLLPGIRRVFPATEPGERIQVTGKTGEAYGFTVENSWVRNPKNGREVFVSAVLYTNADGIINDDKYEYNAVALPFYADLGELIARRWLRDIPE